MSLKLRIITPDKIFIENKEIDIINLYTIDGQIGVLENMPPFVTSLKISVGEYKINGISFYIYIYGGILSVNKDTCKIITENVYYVDKNGNKLKNNK